MLILRNIIAIALCAVAVGIGTYFYLHQDESQPAVPVKEVRHRVQPAPQPVPSTTSEQSEQPLEQEMTPEPEPQPEKTAVERTESASAPARENPPQHRQKIIRKSHRKRVKPSALRPPYGVHVGSYKNDHEAKKHITRLARDGFTGKNGIFAKEYPYFDKKGEGYLRVLFGPFHELSRAEQEKRKIKKKGEFAAIVHFPGRLSPADNDAIPENARRQVVPQQAPWAPLQQPRIKHAIVESTPATGSARKVQPVVHGDMIMDVMLDYRLIYPGMFCIGKEGTLFIPLSEMSIALEFPINTNTISGIAEGWFLSGERKFNLNVEDGTIFSDQKTFQFTKEQVFVQDEEIYIDLSLFNKLFPLKITPDYYQMQLVVKPFEKLPRQLREQRESGRNILQSGMPPLKYPISDLDYALIAPPRLDAKVSAGYSNPSDSKEYTNGQFSGNYRGDLLFFSASTYFSGSYSSQSDPKFEATSFTMEAEKLFHDNKVVKKLNLGDITPVFLKNVPSGSRERGVYLTNADLIRRNNYDVKTFTGTAIPGWEVELYRNGRLINFTTVGEDGRYAFDDVPLLYGRNDFKMIIYGTEGQVEEREESVRVDSQNRRPGEFIYETSISQINEDVWNPKDSIETEDTGKLRFRAQVSTGVSENISASVGVGSDSLNGKRKNSATAGILAGIGNSLAQVDTAVNSNNGGVASLQWRGMVGKYSVQASHKQQYGEIQQDDSTRQSTSTSISSNTPLTKDIPLSYGISAQRYVLEPASGDKNTNYNMGTSLGLSKGNFNISNNLGATYEEYTTSGDDIKFSGKITARHRIEKVSLRGSAAYRIDADTPMKNVTLNVSRPLTKSTSGELGIEANMENEDYRKYHGQVSWSADEFNLFTRMEVQDSGAFSTSIGLSTAMDFSPREWWKPEVHKGSNVQTGGLSCRVFLDNDFDGKYSDADSPVEGVILQTTQLGRTVKTDKNGIAEFDRLPPMYASDVEIKESSLKDPRYVTSRQGIAIIPRKGRIYTMDFPLLVSGEIEGTAFSALSGTPNQKSGIPLELVSENGDLAASGYSDYDGYYFFSGVLPGHYSVRVAENYLQTKKISFISDGEIIVGKGGKVKNGHIIMVGNKDYLEKKGRKLLEKARKSSFSSETDLLIAELNGVKQASKKVVTTPVAKEKKTANSSQSKTNDLTIKNIDKKPSCKRIVLDLYKSKKSAQRAAIHYRRHYSSILKGGIIQYIRTKDGYLLFAEFSKPIQNMDAMARKMLLTPEDLELSKKISSMSLG